MIAVDLKLALFVALLAVVGSAVAVWLSTRHILHRLRSPNPLLAHVREELPFGLVVLHADGTVIRANAEAQRLVPDLAAFPSLLSDKGLHRSNESPRQRSPSSGLITHPMAARWWRYQLNDQMSLLILLDRSEYQRLISRQQLFIGQLAHELRTPLTALIAQLEVARNPATSDALRATLLDTLQHETDRLARLVRDLLELHRLETSGDLAFYPTNLLLVAEDAMAQIFPHAEQRGVCLTMETIASLPLVLAHSDRLKQVFLNLLDNAVKYCRPDDSIVVRLEATPDGVRCSVADTGPGISSTDMPRVRDPLYRGRTDVEGNGIGLALVGEILRRHHTTLDITSSTTPGQSGTVCSWTLRYADAEEQVRS